MRAPTGREIKGNRVKLVTLLQQVDSLEVDEVKGKMTYIGGVEYRTSSIEWLKAHRVIEVVDGLVFLTSDYNDFVLRGGNKFDLINQKQKVKKIRKPSKDATRYLATDHRGFSMEITSRRSADDLKRKMKLSFVKAIG